MYRLLVVEDEQNIRESIDAALSETYDIKTAPSAEKAITLLEKEHFDLLITDIRLPGMNGIDLLKKFKEQFPQARAIVITAFSSIESAVEAMRAGADEYVPKPFSLDELDIKVKNILNASRTEMQRDFYEKEKQEAFGEIKGSGPAISRIKADIAKVAASDANVLITGETGTGKELVAYTIHRLSGRKGPFVPVHCSAYGKGVIESELFGHEKGAFTGADKQRKGRIEYARDGTVFLDELGDIPLDIQVKLLRVLENRTFERVGGNASIRTNARVVCATNKDLKAMIKDGTFREDLYYRVNVFPLHVPPLRERREDIPELVRSFIEKRDGAKLDEDGEAALAAYSWPGNVRELQNVIERAFILAENGILNVRQALGGAPLNEPLASEAPAGGLEEKVSEIEKRMIQEAMGHNGNNQTKAAKSLKISRTTLQYKMQKYGIEG